MKLAIPEFNGRVSPVFDCCRRLLVIDTSATGPDRIVPQDWSELESAQRPERLREMGVNTLLCGGISAHLARKIEAGGVYVIPWVSGEIGEIIDAFMKDRLPDPGLTMPGCRRGRFRGERGSREGLQPECGPKGRITSISRWR